MFCRYCGNEVADNAVICTKCGCLVHNAASGAGYTARQNQAYAPQTPAPAPLTEEELAKKRTRKFFRLSKIFSGVATAISCVTFLCALWFFVLMDAALSSGSTSGVNYGGMAIAIFALFGLYGMLIASPFALTTGILAFVFKKKSVERTGAFPIVAFVLGIVSFAVTVLFFALLCT